MPADRSGASGGAPHRNNTYGWYQYFYDLISGLFRLQEGLNFGLREGYLG
jgi:hypothetical protein